MKERPDGVRYIELVREISAWDSRLKRGTIQGNIWDLDTKYSKIVYKPSRGLFRLIEFRDVEKEDLGKKKPGIKEQDFYQPFADWLVNEMEDCTKAISLGGNRFGDKWGTPDVIGKREPMRSDIIKAPVEITSCEIKLDQSQLVIAFGQACAYCLFSHKCYLVIPRQASQEEIARLDSLCQVFGIGLVLFDATSVEDPDFTIRVRPKRQNPDLFYANKNMKTIEKELFPS